MSVGGSGHWVHCPSISPSALFWVHLFLSETFSWASKSGRLEGQGRESWGVPHNDDDWGVVTSPGCLDAVLHCYQDRGLTALWRSVIFVGHFLPREPLEISELQNNGEKNVTCTLVSFLCLFSSSAFTSSYLSSTAPAKVRDEDAVLTMILSLLSLLSRY